MRIHADASWPSVTVLPLSIAPSESIEDVSGSQGSGDYHDSIRGSCTRSLSGAQKSKRCLGLVLPRTWPQDYSCVVAQCHSWKGTVREVSDGPDVRQSRGPEHAESDARRLLGSHKTPGARGNESHAPGGRQKLLRQGIPSARAASAALPRTPASIHGVIGAVLQLASPRGLTGSTCGTTFDGSSLRGVPRACEQRLIDWQADRLPAEWERLGRAPANSCG